MALYWSFLLPSLVCLAFTCFNQCFLDIYFNFIGCFVPPKPEVILTAEEEAKAQKALAARNREREQNKLRMRRVREAQRAAKVAEKVSFPVG